MLRGRDARTRRQAPRLAELLELVKFKKPELNGKRRRVYAALTIADLRTTARRRTSRAAFDYTDGAAEGELSLAWARQAFADVDRYFEVLGGPSELPFGIAPTGFTFD